ncbi:MAG: albIV [Candidatus Eremiobacteraeota bacterium]|nr:albIV [Candidatus Eremiobacteraeota bacterium]
MNGATSKTFIFDAALKQEREYWLQRLAGETGLSTIVRDDERPRGLGAELDETGIALGGASYQRLRGFTGGSPFLMYVFLMTALKVCLHKYTGSEVVVTGSPALKALGRANALAIVDDVKDGATFRELLVAVRATLLEAYKRQSYPFSRLVQDLGRAHSGERCPLFDVVLAFRELHGDLPELRNDLTITFAQGADELSGRIAFRRGLACSDAVTRFAGHLLRVVEEALDEIDKRVADIGMLTSRERDEIVREWNRTTAEYPKTTPVSRLFEEQVARTPDAVAVVANGAELSYRELNRRANRLARTLRSDGIGSGSVVGIMMDRSPEMLTGVLATLKAGAAYLPLDASWPESRIAFVMRESAMKVVLTKETAAGTDAQRDDDLDVTPDPQDVAYILYTSGSTGEPKGIVVEHRAVVNYVWWAKKQYLRGEALDFPLFSPLTFDLTVTSVFVPLVSGGKVVIYGDDERTREPSIVQVIADGAVGVVKLTPAHLELIKHREIAPKRIKKLILGGEDLKTATARAALRVFGNDVEVYNEYGPTETVVGCMIHRFDAAADTAASVPIGKPADNVRIYVLDAALNPVPAGVVGEIYIAGDGLARGYLNRPDLTAEKFVPDPFAAGARMYRTGDLARRLPDGNMEFRGRADHQVKIRGARIELAEVEAALSAHADVRECVVDVVRHGNVRESAAAVTYCATCGLPSNYPGATFDAAGVCNECHAFDAYRDKALNYFRPMDELHAIVEKVKAAGNPRYDCMVLYSGGKDSTYALYQLASMGLRILAFTLDNGYISEGAKANIRRVVGELNVDHVFGATPFMRSIFADSLRKNGTVCDGCFKTIYTLSANAAREHGISYIFTGLSRGQLFETRLAELFHNNVFDVDEIDRYVIEARKLYHQMDDVISRSLDVAMFKDEATYDNLTFVDFYRYCDVQMDEIYDFLRKSAPWIRPKDTGRSTNCLINEVGIYVHKKTRGYHNYALPYCWDVRMGHKTREAALRELDEHIDVNTVNSILAEIGYDWEEASGEDTDASLVGYYVSEKRLAVGDLRAYLSERLPEYMVPSYFIRLDAMPLTRNGKVDRKALPQPKGKRPDLASAFAPPTNPVEAELAEMWARLLGQKQVGIHDNFFDLGGHSLLAARVMARVRTAFDVDVPVSRLFEVPTVAALAVAIGDARTNDVASREPALVRIPRAAHRRQRSPVTGDLDRSAAGDGS